MFLENDKPAILGGNPTRSRPFRLFWTIGKEEEEAAQRVLRSGKLSGFLGAPSPEFLGGPEVLALEKEWQEHFGVRHAIAVNSATSGLFAAVGALKLGPGDEVIVPPLTMSASVVAPLIYGAIPVFADVSEATFTIDPSSVQRLITRRTKAIMVVNLFGHPAEWEELTHLAKKYKLALIEDNAQAPGAFFRRKATGTLGDIGVFSLNRHKHIQTGEGGVIVTNQASLAERLRLIRNHGESVIQSLNESDLVNMVGFNYRMTEIEAALARSQLKKLDSIIEKKKMLGEILRQELKDIPGVIPPRVANGSTHVYYLFPLRIDEERLGLSKKLFVKSLKLEGIPVNESYVKPLYQLPLFQKGVAMSSRGYPFSLAENQPVRKYPANLCPTAERLYSKELCTLPWCAYDFDEEDVRDMAKAIKKIVQFREEIERHAAETDPLVESHLENTKEPHEPEPATGESAFYRE